MKLMLDIPDLSSEISIKHGQEIVLMGSCFSDNLAPYIVDSGFQTLSNPFGTIFHPLALSRVLNDVLDQNSKADSVIRGDLWFDWRSTNEFGRSEEELQSNLDRKFKATFSSIKNASLLVITLGTSWGYRKDNQIVANCHKMSSNLFEKELTDLEAMQSEWKSLLSRLQEFNPKLKIVFTVSPVRHIKDGVVENNRSKARLLELAHSLQGYGSYFPSYEIVMDILRDYRFFKEDMVHPNDQAVKIVWSTFEKYIFNEETQKLNSEVQKLNRMKQHRSLHPDSEEDKKFRESVVEFESKLKNNYPNIYFK